MNKAKNINIFKLLPGLWRHVTIRRRIQLLLLFLLMLLVSVAELISIGAVLPFLGVLTSPEIVYGHPIAQPLVKFLGLSQPAEMVAPMTILFGMAAVLSGGFRLLLNWSQTRLSYAMGADFSMGIYKRTLYQAYSVHLMRNTSEIISGVTSKADGVVHQTVMPLLVIVSSSLMLVTVLLGLFSIQPIVTASAIFCFGTIYGIVIFITRRHLLNNGDVISQQQNRVVKVLQEALGGIRDVIIDGAQNAYCDIYRDADWKLRRAQSNISIISVSPRFLVESFGLALIAGMAYYLTSRPSGFESAIPIIGTLAFAAQRMLPLLQQAYASWSSIRGGQACLSDALIFLDQPLPENADKPAPNPIPFNSTIGFNHLGFRYSDAQPWIFRNLNLKITKSSRIGFVGSTGSGKSTLLDVLMGLLSPSEGSLEIDGHIITSSDWRAWQAHIAHVPQSIFLSDATLAENIAFGVPLDQIDFERLEQSAKSAQIANVIESWPNGYKTVVGERGVRLSGGQRQRIGIARALYKQSNIIIFDEATSALDSETENAVMNAIDTLDANLTVLIIAHRLSTLKNCTKIVELSEGRIKRVGSYGEIMADMNRDGNEV